MMPNDIPEDETLEDEEGRDIRPKKAKRSEMEAEEEFNAPVIKKFGGGGLAGVTGGSLGKSIMLCLGVTLAILFLLASMGGGWFLTKKDFELNLTGMVDQLNAAKASMDTSKAALDTAVQNLPSTVTGQVNNAISGKLDDLNELSDKVRELESWRARADTSISVQNTKIAALETKIADLEVVKEEEESTSYDEFTRWVFKNERITYSSTVVPSTILIYVDDVDPSRIEDEGLYEVALIIENTSLTDNWTMGYAELELVLEPRDYTPVNDDDTYIDSDNSPWLTWDSDFAIRTREGQDVCRRITFTSDRYNFNELLSPGEKYQIDLVLELYYS